MAMITQYWHPRQTPQPPPGGDLPPVTIPGFPAFTGLRGYGDCCLTTAQMEVILAYLSSFSFSSERTADRVLAQIGIWDVRSVEEFAAALVGLAAEMAGLTGTDTQDLWKLAQAAGWNRVTQIQRWLVFFEATSLAAHAYVGCATVTGTADPRNVVTPTCIGQIYIDTVNQNVFRANGTGSANWALEYHWT